MLIYLYFDVMPNLLSLSKVICRMKWMPRIPLFLECVMLIVLSSCFATHFPFDIFRFNNLLIRIFLCAIRGYMSNQTSRGCGFFVRKLLSGWCIRYIVYGLIISWLKIACQCLFWWISWSETIITQVDAILHVVKLYQLIATSLLTLDNMANGKHQKKRISYQVEWLRRSRCAPLQPREIPWWRITSHLVSIHCVALHIGFRLPSHHVFPHCWSPFLIEHCGIAANCDHMSQRVHWVHACIGIATGWVALRNISLAFLPPVCKIQFSLS